MRKRERKTDRDRKERDTHTDTQTHTRTQNKSTDRVCKLLWCWRLGLHVCPQREIVPCLQLCRRHPLAFCNVVPKTPTPPQVQQRSASKSPNKEANACTHAHAHARRKRTHTRIHARTHAYTHARTHARTLPPLPPRPSLVCAPFARAVANSGYQLRLARQFLHGVLQTTRTDMHRHTQTHTDTQTHRHTHTHTQRHTRKIGTGCGQKRAGADEAAGKQVSWDTMW